MSTTNIDKKIIGFNLYNKAKPLEYNVATYISSVYLYDININPYTTKIGSCIPAYDNVLRSYNKKLDLIKNYPYTQFIIPSNTIYSFVNTKHIYTRFDYLPVDYFLISQNVLGGSFDTGNDQNIKTTKITGIDFQYHAKTQNNDTTEQTYTQQIETGLFNELNEFTVTFLYYVQPQKYGILQEPNLPNTYRNNISNYKYPHYTSIIDNFISIKDNRLDGNPFGDSSTTLNINLFETLSFDINIPLNINNLYFILKYVDNNITLEVYNIDVTRTEDSTNGFSIDCPLTQLFDTTQTLSTDINNVVDISKTRLSVQSKISNIKFLPVIMDDYFIKDFDTLQNDGMQYHF